MKEQLKPVSQAFEGTSDGLDGIINTLMRIPNKTYVIYKNGTIEKYDITGELGRDSIPDKSNVIKVKIGNTVSSIGKDAFRGFSSLSSVIIPNSITSIEDYGFIVCSELISLTIPDSVISIGDGVFSGCEKLTAISIPSSVINIGSYQFRGCNNITNILVDPNNSVYDSRENCNGIIKTDSNTLIAGCKNTIIPNNVNYIGNYAFFQCESLSSIVIPDSVSIIGSCAFMYCSNLSSVTVGNGLTNIYNQAFQSCFKLKYIELPDNVINIGLSAFQSCGLESIKIGSGITNISGSAFFACKNLKSFTCMALSAPSVSFNTFGRNSTSFTGWNTHSTGENVLKVPQDATGYDSGTWLNILQNPERCGFHIVYE